MSRKELLKKLSDPAYRSELVSSEIDVGLPMQIRSMRESRGWRQSFVAEKTGTKQPRFSLMEKPGYGKFSLNTLKKLAALFDVGLIVSFVPWSEMINFADSLSRKRLSIAPFDEEDQRATSVPLRGQSVAWEESGLTFVIPGTSQTAFTLPISTIGASYQETGQTSQGSVQVTGGMIANAQITSTILGGSESYVSTYAN